MKRVTEEARRLGCLCKQHSTLPTINFFFLKKRHSLLKKPELMATMMHQEKLWQMSLGQEKTIFNSFYHCNLGQKPSYQHKLECTNLSNTMFSVLGSSGRARGAGAFLCISTRYMPRHHNMQLPCSDMQPPLSPLRAIRQAQKAKYKPNRSRKSHMEKKKDKKELEVTSRFS